MTRDQIARDLEGFIRAHFRVPDTDRSFNADAHLYDGGFVDSAGVIELIAFVESTFNVTLEDDDVFDDAFVTINGISNLVHARLGDNGAGRAEPDDLTRLSGRGGVAEMPARSTGGS